MLQKNKIIEYLNEIQSQAEEYSGCKKVKVGALLIPHNSKTYIYGFNRAVPDLCRSEECRRIQLYGEDSKSHRLPSDCRSIHSEVDAICNAAKFGISTYNSTLIVTRYPCEACARAIVSAGIKEVYYGREQEISEETARIFSDNKIKVQRVDWTYEDTRR